MADPLPSVSYCVHSISILTTKQANNSNWLEQANNLTWQLFLVLHHQWMYQIRRILLSDRTASLSLS